MERFGCRNGARGYIRLSGDLPKTRFWEFIEVGWSLYRRRGDERVSKWKYYVGSVIHWGGLDPIHRKGNIWGGG